MESEVDFKVAEECARLSDLEKITFPEVVGRLIHAGIELYYADLLSHTKIFYAGDQAHTVHCLNRSKNVVSENFNAEGVVQTIRAVQKGEFGYQEFLRRIMHFGVIGYIAFIRGQKVIYFGRKGEQHIEAFPKK